MVLIGLLLIALICLALGLVLPSATWLVASLIASAGAGFLLWRARRVIGAPKPAAASAEKTAASTEHAAASTEQAAASEPAPAEAAAADSAESSAAGVAATEGVARAHTEVWVIDGRPRYHLADCAIIQGQDAEPIPFEQATEDGFMPCSLCEPNAVRAG